jgi:hypothetical protein
MRNRSSNEVNIEPFLLAVPDAEQNLAKVYTSLARGLQSPPAGSDPIPFLIGRLESTQRQGALRALAIQKAIQNFSKFELAKARPQIKLSTSKKPQKVRLDSDILQIEAYVIMTAYLNQMKGDIESYAERQEKLTRS